MVGNLEMDKLADHEKFQVLFFSIVLVGKRKLHQLKVMTNN